MKNKEVKSIKNVFITLIVLGIVFLLANLAYAIWGEGQSNKSEWLTLIAGWISGLATFSVGIIAYVQTEANRKIDYERQNYVDLTIENIETTFNSIPKNVLGRICILKNADNEILERFRIVLYNYNENPIFDVGISKLTINEIPFDYSLQPIQKDEHGKSFLIKNDFMYLTANLPKIKNTEGHYKIHIGFKNQLGEYFEKQIEVDVDRKCNPTNCKNLKQQLSKKI